MSMDDSKEMGLLNLPIYEEIYDRFLENPNSVDSGWQELFRRVDTMGLPSSSPAEAPQASSSHASNELRVYHLIQAYRKYGHLVARINPIDPHPVDEVYQLKLSTLGFSEEELGQVFPTLGIGPSATAPLSETIALLKEIYCNRIGVEYIDLHSSDMEKWLQSRIEPTRFRPNLSIEEKKLILQHLNSSELFESFIHTKYPGQKRFSLEGGETLIPMMDAIIEKGADLGMEEFVIGMAHRGRINVLTNILNKFYGEIFTEFEDVPIGESVEGSGDVKYHKGYFAERQTARGKDVSITLMPNPSHLEAVNPVVLGHARARQILLGEEKVQNKVTPILIHGDAAIAGQGIVYEILQFYNLNGYSSGGIIHIVINNQIGFTTLPKDARSTRYCTDIAKAFQSPVLHVNAEDPEGCVHAVHMACELRQKYHCDVFIDLNCYRKYGHNESDEPAFTQPLEYQMIRKKKPIRELYRDQLLQQGVVERQVAEALEEEFKAKLQEAMQLAKSGEALPGPAAEEETVPRLNKELMFFPVKTALGEEELKTIGAKALTVPDNLKIHKKLARVLKTRLQSIENGEKLDWATAELLAMASLTWEGVHVRLSGQDARRGTFSQRHVMWTDQDKEQKYFPLNHLKPDQGRFDVFNSPLSEFGVLGFEFGYTLAWSDALVMWEAQFGDFCNGAQIIIDQFIAPSEQKWNKASRLVMLLPHGYEGQGPEHSSGRMERFLSLCGDWNIVVTNPTTPAQYFHLLRRQVMRTFRKPLVVFTPKGLLRHPGCVSSLKELASGAFQEVIDDPSPAKNPKKLVFCSGKIYYDLIAHREHHGEWDHALIRMEQLYPIHRDRVAELVEKYAGFEEVIWVQEEPKNMGAWAFIHRYIQNLLPDGHKIQYIGRHKSASPAVGSFAVHKKEQEAIMEAVLPTT